MEIDKKLRYIPALGESYFLVDSLCIAEAVRYIVDNKAGNLILNGRSGYKLNHLNWLSEVGEYVKKLIITPPSGVGFSWSGLSYCQSMVKLKVNDSSGPLINLGANSRLIELDIENCARIEGLENLINLETAILGRVPLQKQREAIFSMLKQIKYLCLAECDLSRGVGFLANCPVQRLSICSGRKCSLKFIEVLGIDFLEINRTRAIIDMESVVKSNSIQTLKIIDSDKISDIKGFIAMKSLKSLTVLGSSYFVNGDISDLRGKLEQFIFDNKRHYNIRYSPGD